MAASSRKEAANHSTLQDLLRLKTTKVFVGEARALAAFCLAFVQVVDRVARSGGEYVPAHAFAFGFNATPKQADRWRERADAAFPDRFRRDSACEGLVYSKPGAKRLKRHHLWRNFPFVPIHMLPASHAPSELAPEAIAQFPVNEGTTVFDLGSLLRALLTRGTAKATKAMGEGDLYSLDQSMPPLSDKEPAGMWPEDGDEPPPRVPGPGLHDLLSAMLRHEPSSRQRLGLRGIARHPAVLSGSSFLGFDSQESFACAVERVLRLGREAPAKWCPALTDLQGQLSGAPPTGAAPAASAEPAAETFLPETLGKPPSQALGPAPGQAPLPAPPAPQGYGRVTMAVGAEAAAAVRSSAQPARAGSTMRVLQPPAASRSQSPLAFPAAEAAVSGMGGLAPSMSAGAAGPGTSLPSLPSPRAQLQLLIGPQRHRGVAAQPARGTGLEDGPAQEGWPDHRRVLSATPFGQVGGPGAVSMPLSAPDSGDWSNWHLLTAAGPAVASREAFPVRAVHSSTDQTMNSYAEGALEATRASRPTFTLSPQDPPAASMLDQLPRQKRPRDPDAKEPPAQRSRGPE
mmetsp:Transcript_19893/g.76271  ORF Transcript_19893/g.76271 Transcript_19893/m.76271 type:complete len:572 (+) Transcript_19893:177-1892(+)